MQPDATQIHLETFANDGYSVVSTAVLHLQAVKLDAIFEIGLDIFFEAMRRDAEAIQQACAK